MSTNLASNAEVGGLEAVLDDCLSQLNRGESLESCLAQHPTHAAWLEPLLRLAVQFQALRQDQRPAPAALRAGKQQLLRQAARLRNAQPSRTRTRRIPWWSNLQLLMRRSMAAVAVASLLLVIILGRGAIAASANSLPGDTLYPVKRISEEVRLLLTFDRQVKIQLLREMDERRLEEVKAIANSQRIIEMSFRGRVERVDGSHWTISGIPVEISSETVIEGDVTAGTLVRVHVRSLSDGTLLALHVVPEAEVIVPQSTASPTQPEPTVTAMATSTPTEIPATPVPVQPQQPPQTLAPTSTDKPRATPRPTFMPSPTATLVPTTPAPPREVKVRFRGRIESIATNAWTVDGQVVRIDATTRIDEQAGNAAVGATATVLAIRLEDGTLLAIEITIEQVAQATEQPFEFQGLIESFGPTQWIVGGHTLIISADTIIENTPQKGLLAEVKALRRGDGALVAIYILVRLPIEVVQFEGVIQSLGAEEWIVDGVTVRLDAQSVVVGTPVVGSLVEVEGLLLPDDAVLARRIVVQPAVTATPTEPVRPAELPTASPTQLPTANATQPPTVEDAPCQTAVAPGVSQRLAALLDPLPLSATAAPSAEEVAATQGR